MNEMTLNEIKKTGIEALYDKLGPVGMIRFLQLYDKGSGDYTKERHEWLDKLVHEDIVTQLKKKQ